MLDFDMFPHIRDSIVQYACPKSLMALRGASHDLRRLCDERLFDHVEIEITFDGVVLVHPFGTGLAFEWMRLDVFINSVPLQDIPAAYRKAYSDPESRAPERKLLRQYIQSRMEIARVVDLRREHEQPLLRCRKITVHLLDPHGAGRPGTGGLWVRKPAADIGINTPTQPQGDQISRRWPIQLTVVGGIEQLRLAFGLSPAPPAKLCAELGVAAQVVRPHDMGFAYEAPPPYLRFLTPEAYVEEVGAEQFALETQLDPYEGPAAMYVP